MRWSAAAVVAFAVAAHGQSVVWSEFDPAAVRTDRTQPATLRVQTSGVSAVALDYAAGGRLTLAPAGANIWSANVDAAKLLSGYDSSDANHNFVGFLRLLGPSGETLATYNEFINVIDANVPALAVTDLGNGARATPRVLNLYRPLLSSSDVQSAAQQFYTYERDDFDFLAIVFALPAYPANRYHFAVRNDVSGIGLAIVNNSSQYGSAGALAGITVFPIDTLFDGADPAFSHELGHQWINFLQNASLKPGPHWPASTMARGLMGFNIPPTNEGGDFPWNIEPVTATTARTTSGQPTGVFDDFDLYLMGLLPPAAVRPGIVLLQQPCNNCVIPTAPITVNDVIQVNGPRVPSTSKPLFHVGTVVITRDRPLNDDEMNMMEFFASRSESNVPLAYASGFAKGTAKPFAVATRGLAHIDSRLNPPPPRHRIVRH